MRDGRRGALPRLWLPPFAPSNVALGGMEHEYAHTIYQPTAVPTGPYSEVLGTRYPPQSTVLLTTKINTPSHSAHTIVR